MNKKIYFISVCLVMFATNFANSAQGILLSDFITHYGLESARQGYMGTFQSIGCVASCFIIMLLASRIKRWQVLIGCAGLIFISMLLIGTKPSFVVLLLMYFLIGIGYSATTNVASSLASDLFKGKASAMGLVHVFFGMGGLLAPIVLQSALRKMDWGYVCMLDAAVVFFVLIVYLVSCSLFRSVTAQIPENGSCIRASEIGGFLRSGRNLLLIAATFGYMAFQNGVNVWIVRYVSVELNAELLGAYTLSAFWIGNAIARLTLTRLKVRTEVIFCIGNILTVAAMVGGILIGTPAAMIVCIVICGLTSGASIPQIYHMGCSWNEGKSLLATSLLGLTMWTSSIATSPLTAFITKWGLTAAMWAVVVYAVIGAVALLPMMRKVRAS